MWLSLEDALGRLAEPPHPHPQTYGDWCVEYQRRGQEGGGRRELRGTPWEE